MPPTALNLCVAISCVMQGILFIAGDAMDANVWPGPDFFSTGVNFAVRWSDFLSTVVAYEYFFGWVIGPLTLMLGSAYLLLWYKRMSWRYRVALLLADALNLIGLFAMNLSARQL
jgi:hypothetical protein